MMKNRMLQLFITIFGFMCIPFTVNAAGTVTMTISCPSTVYIGETAECKVRANHSGFTVTDSSLPVIGGFSGSYASSNHVSITSFTKNTIWSGDIADGLLSIYTDKTSPTPIEIGVIKIKGVTAGRGNVNIKNIVATGPYPDYEDISVANVSASFTVKAQTTKTTRKTTTTTTKKKTTRTTTTSSSRSTTTRTHTTITTTRGVVPGDPNTTTGVLRDPLALSSVTVDNFDVTYQDGKYYVTVDYTTEEVTVSATAADGIVIIGTGVRTLVPGKNVVDLILRGGGQSATVQVVITRPEDGNADSTLSSLKVVNYDIKFEKGKKEFTVTVPFNTKEIYIVAKSTSDAAIITGDGLQTISGGKQDFYVRVSYGDIESTEYKITVKKSYGLIIMWVLIIGLGGGIFGVYYYFKKNGVASTQKNQAAATKEKAMMNRKAAAQGQGISLNGEKNAGIGKRVVAPTPVAQVAKTESEDPVNLPNQQVAPGAVVPKTVMVKKEPVQVAASAPDAQVKLVKTVSTVPTGNEPSGEVVKNSQ